MGISMVVRKVLYLGIDPIHFKTDGNLVHMPLIKIVSRPLDSKELHTIFDHVSHYTHIIFTSKSAVKIFFSYFKAHHHVLQEIMNKQIVAIGHMTAQYLKEEGVAPGYIAADETEEGVVRALSALDLKDAYVLLPKSSLPRPHLTHFLVEHEVRHQICVLYDACETMPSELIDLDEVDEIVFTNPLTVRAFFSIYNEIPSSIKLHPLGNMTREALREKLKEAVVARELIGERV